MIDREKVMKGLKSCVKSKGESCPKKCPFFADCFVRGTQPFPIYPVIEAAFSLLEPQPVLNIADSVMPGRDVGECPSCGKTIVNDKDIPTRFCKFCGQELTWDA